MSTLATAAPVPVPGGLNVGGATGAAVLEARVQEAASSNIASVHERGDDMHTSREQL
jgi:hypothetical protein